LKKAKLFGKDKGEVLKKWAVALPGMTPDLKDRVVQATTFDAAK
jgi:hypothetical protein